MSNFDVPKTVKTYFQDKSLKTAINSLVEKLDGKKMPELDWAAARHYSKALLMAAQVRADYVEMHFALWEATFGISNADSLGDPYFDWDEDPSLVWEECYLRLSFYRTGSPDEAGKNDDLYVSFEDDLVSLKVYRYQNDDTELDFPAKVVVGGWEAIEEEGHLGAHTKPVAIGTFFKNPDKHVAEMKTAADRMVTYLSDN